MFSTKGNKTKFFLISIVLILVGFICFLILSQSKNSNKITIDSKIVNIYYWGDIPKFNPIQPDSIYIWWIQNLIWDRIITVDEQFVWSPAIAESWSFNADRTELKIKINRDVTWSDGRSLIQKDFEFSYFFYKDDSFKAAIYEPILSRIKTLSYLDNILTLKLDPKFKSDPFFATHTYWTHIMNTVKLYPFDFKSNSYLGTGAYKIDRFKNSGQLELSVNTKSWIFDKYKNLVMPKKLFIKSIFSDQKMDQILSLKKGLILGQDIYALDKYNWSPVKVKTETVSLSFNLSKFSIDERKYIYSLFHEINDLEKLNLKYKNITIHKDAIPDISKVIIKNNNLKNIDVMYFRSDDEKWLTYLNEKIKKLNLNLNLIKVSHSVFNEKVFNKNYDIFVDTNIKEDFYPHYLSYHSKGSYNYKGWDDSVLDHDLEKLIFIIDPKKTKDQIHKIKNYVDTKYSEVPMFSYETSVLWTRNPCKPIQTQFQGLGLIYKAIICADNY